MKNSKNNFDKILEIDGTLITAKYVKTLNKEERLSLIDPLFHKFRSIGWLYPDDIEAVNDHWKKLLKFEPDLSTNELFNNNSLATNICKHFCHNFYDATEENSPKMKDIFNDDEKLKKLIGNRLGLAWYDKDNNDETFNISFRMLIQGMRSARMVPSISMFKPNIAKYMYMKYSDEGDVVFDYSIGWGGRMLGAAASNRKYIGVDPLTSIEVSNIVKHFNLENITLVKSGSENFILEENSIDFSFSSPPYFNQEVYSSDLTQSYNNGEKYFYEIYWNNTLKNVKKMLKPGKWFGLNITDKYDRMINMAKQEFGDVVEIVKLRTVRNHLTKTAGDQKYESIFMFKNIK